MRARKGFPVPDRIKPALPLSIANFSSIEPAEHLFHLSEQLFHIFDSSISLDYYVGYNAEFLLRGVWEGGITAIQITPATRLDDIELKSLDS